MYDHTFHLHYTDSKLAADLMALVPMRKEDTYLDPCCGLNKAFFNHAICRKRYWCEIDSGRDFFKWRTPVDWIVSNPPFPKMREFHDHSMWLAKKGIGWLINYHVWLSFSSRRLELMARRGWYLHHLHIVEVKRWSFPYYFILFLRTPASDLTWRWKRYE